MSQNIRSVLFYTDAAAFGGHEILTVEAASYLSRQDGLKVFFAFYEGNTLLREKLEAINNNSKQLAVFPLPYSSKPLAAIRTLVSWHKRRRLEAFMRSLNPEIVVVSQGRVEGSSLGLIAAKRAGLRTVSYIPMAHPISICGRPIAVRIREKINRYFYLLPDKFITISESSRRMLRERGVKCDIEVVQNAVETPMLNKDARRQFRDAHAIGRNECAVAVIGRLSFAQKAQDFVVEAISRFGGELANWKFFFVGEGPDEVRLRRLIANLGLGQRTKVLSWTKDINAIYAGIDALLIPSRFEGVPLVMLEALSHGLPVIAANVDGMSEVLPKNWLFEPCDAQGMIATLLRTELGHQDESTRERLPNEIHHNFSMDRFGAEFSRAVRPDEFYYSGIPTTAEHAIKLAVGGSD